MKLRSVVPMRIAKVGYIILSIVFCIIGALLVALPELYLLLIGRTLGIAMIIFGGIKLVGYFSKDLYRLAFQYDMEFGILLVVLGLIILIKPLNVINLIFSALGIAILADGLFKVQIAVDSKQFGISRWWLILSLAILTAMVGLLLVFLSTENAKILTVLLGISLLAEGILNFCVAVITVKIIKHQQPDVIEGDQYKTNYVRKE